MKTTVLGHGAFLLATLALAFVAWTYEKSDGSAAPVLLDARPDALTRVHYRWPKGELELTFEGAGDEREPVVKLTREVATKKPKAEEQKAGEGTASAEAAGAASDEDDSTETEISRFPAGRSVLRSLEKLAPFQARRSLGVPDKERLKVMELEAPERTLVIEAGERRIALELGKETYGNQGRYARVSGKEEVHLLESAATSGLEGTPSRLMEARLVPIDLEEIVEVELRAGDRGARFVHVDRDQAKKRYFAPKGQESERSEEAGGLVSTLHGLRSNRFVDDEPPSGSAEVASVIVVRTDGKPLELKLYELPDGSGYRARAGRWMAEISAAQGKNVVEDVLAVLPAP